MMETAVIRMAIAPTAPALFFEQSLEGRQRLRGPLLVHVLRFPVM
jgi:hypothetical protein